MLMGAADVVPGVSGGTVAFVLGIYHRLVTAISHFDGVLVAHVLRRQWLAAARRVDLAFLLTLGSGIALGIAALAKVMRHLLEHHHMETMAVFFGLILGSTLLVVRRIRLPSATAAVGLLFAGIVAACFAWWVAGLEPGTEATNSMPYIFVCGMIAICAMILPGVSGAYLLLVFGLYYQVTDIIHRVTRLEATSGDWLTIVVFAGGCAVGLLLFSKLLRWLLANVEPWTMTVLCGLMIGFLRKVWPFQMDTTPDVAFKHKVFTEYWPEALSTDVVVAAILVIVAGAAVLGLEQFGRIAGASASEPATAE